MLRFQRIDNRMEITQVRGLFINHILSGGGLKLKSKLRFWIGLVYNTIIFTCIFLLPRFIKKKISQTINKILIKKKTWRGNDIGFSCERGKVGWLLKDFQNNTFVVHVFRVF